MHPGTCLIVLTALALGACDGTSRASGETTETLHRVALHTVRWQDSYEIEREFAGQVEAPQNPEVAFELGGRISELEADDGDAVRAGAVLATLDMQLLEAEGDELTARSEEIDADLELARRNLARIERLAAEQLASQRERDELASRVRLLEATRDRNQASLAANRIRLEKSVLRSPFDARVGLRQADAGAVVAAGAPVFTLVETGRRQVRAGLPLPLAQQLNPGDPVNLRVGEDRVVGTVVAIGEVMDQATRSQVVRLGVAGNWPPGELAYLQVGETEPQAGAWLPDTAVTEGLRGAWVVYVAGKPEDGSATLEARNVILHHAEGPRLFVSGALEDGDRVVTGGLQRVAPGQRVRVDTGEANRFVPDKVVRDGDVRPES